MYFASGNLEGVNNLKKNSRKILIVGLMTLIVFLVNKLVFALSVVKERLYHNKAHYYQWKFGKIFYTVQGSGPSVLLVHDRLSDSSSYEFHRIVNTLAKEYRVYTIDLLGYGRSDKPKITYTAYLFVQLIIDFRKDIIKEKSSIITSGKSNAFATMACYQDHDLFKNLIFINPGDLNALAKNPKSRDKFAKFILELPILGTSIYNLYFAKLKIEKDFKHKIYNPLNIKTKYIEANNEAAHLGGSSSKYTFASEHCAYMNVNIADTLSHINNNISIIQGTKREESYEAIVTDYKGINPVIECSTIDRAKSLPHLEKPESTLEILSIYLH